ncbi:hypothetical protein OH492_10215 [Vibrio chagasii]|nr:hypothetical protein [Vibrio chagasii]
MILHTAKNGVVENGSAKRGVLAAWDGVNFRDFHVLLLMNPISPYA